jgi:cell division transport system ATP-binding protein
MPKITLDKVSKFYKNKAEKRVETAVGDVELTIRQGEFVFLIGSSGAGKSTLLKLMAGQIRPDRGKVFIGDKDVQWLMRWSRNRASLLFGQVWQESMLAKRQTIGENLMLATQIGNYRRETPRQMRDRVKKVLGLVGITGVEGKYPLELSIGECRRIELARALLHSPPILILDEITANLDDDSMWDLFHLLQELNRKGTTIIMATHASQYVNIMRRRVITMVDGHIFGDVQKGKYGDVIQRSLI